MKSLSFPKVQQISNTYTPTAHYTLKVIYYDTLLTKYCSEYLCTSLVCFRLFFAFFSAFFCTKKINCVYVPSLIVLVSYYYHEHKNGWFVYTFNGCLLKSNAYCVFFGYRDFIYGISWWMLLLMACSNDNGETYKKGVKLAVAMLWRENCPWEYIRNGMGTMSKKKLLFFSFQLNIGPSFRCFCWCSL